MIDDRIFTLVCFILFYSGSYIFYLTRINLFNFLNFLNILNITLSNKKCLKRIVCFLVMTYKM